VEQLLVSLILGQPRRARAHRPGQPAAGARGQVTDSIPSTVQSCCTVLFLPWETPAALLAGCIDEVKPLLCESRSQVAL